VTKNQRDRLTAGIIAVVSEQGYHEATVSQICAAAGVSRRTFYSYFSSKEECYLEAFELIADHLEEAMAEAGKAAASWPEQVRARLGAVVDVFAANPDLVRFALLSPLRAGGPLAARQRQTVERFLQALKQGKPALRERRDPSKAVEEAIAGGMAALIAAKVEARGGKHLEELLPDLVELFLTPYLGREEAVRAARD
jgi:AcrR family transcriptional regulator